VFLEMWRRRDRAVHFEGSLVPWLLGVANNVVRNLNRARRRYDAALFKLPSPPAVPDPADDIAQRLDDESRMREVLRERSLLPASPPAPSPDEPSGRVALGTAWPRE